MDTAGWLTVPYNETTHRYEIELWGYPGNDLADRLDKARRDQRPADDYPAAAHPPRRRDFSLFADAESFSPVHADLRGIGRHCLVYVDADCPDPAKLQPTVDDVIEVFDGLIFPTAKIFAVIIYGIDRLYRSHSEASKLRASRAH